MAQRDKVKELVGRGLNSYHTKALQQMDRIEKKNKEQNHKISILSNELDNDYLSKTEEGSVISLEHSKEGMVYLDELQGNTLVNYCTDGSKEMTLNGDIDLEGTFVTTTEGVDNGKVDVVCEGNTLVNLTSRPIRIYNSNSVDMAMIFEETEFVNRGRYIKPNTTYTVINNNTKKISSFGEYDSTNNYIKGYTLNGNSTLVITTSENAYLWNFMCRNTEGWTENELLENGFLIVLEGDWTNKEIPSEYFEGMKSVGQDDENGHKIEILSQNKNLFNPQEVYQSGYSFGVPFVNSIKCQEENGVFTRITSSSSWNAGIGFHIKTEKNMDYTLSIGEYYDDGVHMELRGLGIYKSEYPFVNNSNIQSYSNRVKAIRLNEDNNSLVYNSKDYDYILFYIGGEWNPDANGAKTFKMSKIEVNQSSVKPNNYTEPIYNKKEISLNEPLRRLPNGVCDKFVKQGGKWYVERNCKSIILTDTTLPNDIPFLEPNRAEGYTVFPLYFSDIGMPNTISNSTEILCNNFIFKANAYNSRSEGQWVCTNAGIYLIFSLPNTVLKSLDRSGFIEWIKDNPIEIIYPIETPTYEEITDVELMTYLDTTHISNNSIIPCNMKIKNSGYNAIIKPSTLYTVALDTNKFGTIGMNLGGAKVTTTNNVATITTPATLSDDSLRLYGKDIKGSKVRILEGDKTNWIPSYFEGMKSSFEDKVQDDGSYKMEILSNNKNLFNENKLVHVGSQKYYWGGIKDWCELHLKPNTTYNISAVKNKEVSDTMGYTYFADTCFKTCKYIIRANSDMGKQGSMTLTTGLDGIILLGKYASFITEYANVLITESNSSDYIDFISHKSNKIQFSSIEPLRGVGDVKDKFVFKDGKLMVERNCSSVTFDGSDNEGWFLTSNPSTNTTRFRINVVPKCYGSLSGYCDKFKVLANTNQIDMESIFLGDAFTVRILNSKLQTQDVAGFKQWLLENPTTVTYQLAEPTYEEVPFELQKIILEGYENGTLFFDTNIPPTSTVTYAGETPIVKSVKLNKTEVLNNTNDINDNIIPYLMDMDYRVVCLQLQSENINDGVSMARLFGGTYEMLQRDIQSKRYSMDEYKHRLDAYLDANKITEEEYNKLGDILNE